jgi:ribose transport system permease protein
MEQVFNKFGKEKINLLNILPFTFLVLVVIVFQILTNGRILSSGSLRSMINSVFTLMLGTAGMTFLLSQGCMDFSIGANVAVSCAVAAIAANINLHLSLPAALLCGFMIGGITGITHAILGVPAFIATLAISFVLKGVATLMLGNGSISVPYTMLTWDTNTLRIIVLIIIVPVFYILFEKSRIGKEIVIIGANPEFAIQCGINIRLVKIRAFLMMGTISGLVAFFALIHSATASISTGAGFEVNTLNAMLLGGMAITGGIGSRFRTAIIGTLTMVVLLTGMNMMRFNARSQQVIEGLVYLVAVSMTFNRKSVAVIK